MRWIIRRLLLCILTIYSSLTLVFFLVRLMPGSPMDVLMLDLMQQGMSYEDALKYVQALYGIELEAPLWVQYVEYIKNFLQGNLGRSYTFFTPVSEIIVYALPWTVFLISISLPMSFGLGVILGMVMAYRRGSKLDSSLSLLATTLTAIPDYVIGLLFLYIFGIVLGIFPSGGNYSIRTTPGLTIRFLSDLLYHATLPVISYVVVSFGGWILTMRSSTLSVLGEDYVMVAEARGLSSRRIALSYVGRNAILPLFTTLAIFIGYMFSGSVFIESVFTYPGMGYFISRSVGGRDYPVLKGCFLLITTAVILANFMADLLYAKLDPRIKLGE